MDDSELDRIIAEFMAQHRKLLPHYIGSAAAPVFEGDDPWPKDPAWIEGHQRMNMDRNRAGLSLILKYQVKLT